MIRPSDSKNLRLGLSIALSVVAVTANAVTPTLSTTAATSTAAVQTPASVDQAALDLVYLKRLLLRYNQLWNGLRMRTANRLSPQEFEIFDKKFAAHVAETRPPRLDGMMPLEYVLGTLNNHALSLAQELRKEIALNENEGRSTAMPIAQLAYLETMMFKIVDLKTETIVPGRKKPVVKYEEILVANPAYQKAISTMTNQEFRNEYVEALPTNFPEAPAATDAYSAPDLTDAEKIENEKRLARANAERIWFEKRRIARQNDKIRKANAERAERAKALALERAVAREAALAAKAAAAAKSEIAPKTKQAPATSR